MEKLTNDQNIKNLKKRKILRSIIIVCCIATIVLSLCSLFFNLHFIFPLIAFIISTILINIREKTPIKISKDLELKRVEKALEKHKKGRR